MELNKLGWPHIVLGIIAVVSVIGLIVLAKRTIRFISFLYSKTAKPEVVLDQIDDDRASRKAFQKELKSSTRIL